MVSSLSSVNSLLVSDLIVANLLFPNLLVANVIAANLIVANSPVANVFVICVFLFHPHFCAILFPQTFKSGAVYFLLWQKQLCRSLQQNAEIFR